MRESKKGIFGGTPSLIMAYSLARCDQQTQKPENSQVYFFGIITCFWFISLILIRTNML